ncbi:hypothetical protein ACHAWC_004193 [Mediolabrus comicus]
MVSAETTTPIPTCRVAIVGAQRQRVARVAAIIHADECLAQVDTLLSVSGLPSQNDPSSSPNTPTQLPIGVPSQVKIEYLPCVATFDSYEDEDGKAVRYLSRLEYHGPNGTLVNGKTLAPFFDDLGESITNDDDDNNDDEIPNPFPGIGAVAIGCGVDTDDDVAKVKTFMDALSSSCASQATDDHNMSMIIECIQPNQEFSSMKEENDAFRDMSDEMKKEVVKNRTIGPGKMANFVYAVAQIAVSQRWQKELSTNATLETEQHDIVQEEEDIDGTAPELVEITEVPHVIDPEKTRYACKRCRSILFGTDDLEDPPHAQSLHNFRKKGQSSSSGLCQNLFIAEPLPWMHGCSEMEGKLHCPKCNTKVGHYCWTGAQCSCGTWVTPAILVPVSKVDEMKPISQQDISGGSMIFARPNVIMANNLQD